MFSAVDPSQIRAAALLQTLRQAALPVLAAAAISPALATASYLVSATRIGTNFYALENNTTVLHTQFCSENAYKSLAYLTMTAGSGNNDGSIRFTDNNTMCDVKAAYTPISLERGTYSARLDYLGNGFYLDTLKQNLLRTTSSCQIFYQQQAQFTITTSSQYANGINAGKITFPDNAFYASCDLLGVYQLRDMSGAVQPLAPLQISNVTVTDTAKVNASLRLNANNDSTAYAVVYDADEPDATNQQVIAGLDNKGNAARYSTSIGVKAGIEGRISLLNLTPGMQYKACAALINELGTLSQSVCTTFSTEWAFLPGNVLRAVPAEAVNTVNRFPLFSASYYLLRNPDVANSVKNDPAAATRHWLAMGLAERRESSVYFDPVWYLQHNQDLITAFGGDAVSAAIHFANMGIAEGREASPAFSLAEYKKRNADLIPVFGNNNAAYFDHYENYGARECRVASRYFNPQYYLASNPDLASLKGNCASALIHWLNFGRKEGRRGAPDQAALPPRQ